MNARSFRIAIFWLLYYNKISSETVVVRRQSPVDRNR